MDYNFNTDIYNFQTRVLDRTLDVQIDRLRRENQDSRSNEKYVRHVPKHFVRYMTQQKLKIIIIYVSELRLEKRL